MGANMELVGSIYKLEGYLLLLLILNAYLHFTSRSL